MSDNKNDFMQGAQDMQNLSDQPSAQPDQVDQVDLLAQDAQDTQAASRQSAETLRAEKLERMNKWYENYKSQLAPSPLEDITKLCAQLELTHAHPSGIAQLFASGKATLQALFRDSGMLRAAGRRLDRVFEDRDNKAHENGVSELSLVVGVASWSGNHVPVLTYPVRVLREAGKDETAATIYFSGNVRLNHALILRLQERGINLSEDALFDGANYQSGTPETSAVFDVICAAAQRVFPDFDIERDIVLGCFTDSGSRFLS